MAATFAGKALWYGIGADTFPVMAASRVAELPFGEPPLAGGVSIAYGNLLDQHVNEDGNPIRDCGPYLTPEGTAKKYEEGVPDPAGPGFAKNFRQQCDLAKSQGHTHIEGDNADDPHFALADVVTAMNIAATYGLLSVAKNPFLLDDRKADTSIPYVANPLVDAMIVESDCGTAAQNDAIRRAAGKPDLMMWFVFKNGERAMAEATKADVLRLGLRNVGITLDESKDDEGEDSEYGGTDVTDILLPTPATASPTMPTAASATPWLDDELADAAVHRYHDADAHTLALMVLRQFPNVVGLSDYTAELLPGTAWCGIYQAKSLAAYGIMPPFGNRDVLKYAYVDGWLNFGTPVSPANIQKGDLGLFIHEFGLHHIACYAGGGKWVGGNQGTEGGGTVSIISEPTPSHIRRPPAISGVPATGPLPSVAAKPPLLMLNSRGPDVVLAQQKLLAKGFDVGPDGADGDFGENTQAAVSAFQIARHFEVDGVIGDETWGGLLDDVATPIAVPGALLPQAAIDKIVALAKASPVASYSWAGRGVVPIGYTTGVCVGYGKVYRDFKSGKPSALVMAQAVGSASSDALAKYELNPTTPIGRLRATVGILFGLGPQESSGDIFETWDHEEDRNELTSMTAEAGAWQQSADLLPADPQLGVLLAEWKASASDGFLSIFRQGISGGPSGSYGTGPGYDFQVLCKTKPQFALETCAIGLRVRRNHWGPINTGKAEYLTAVQSLLQQVEVIIDALPLDGEVLPPIKPPVDPPPVKPPVPALPMTQNQILMLLLALLLKGQSMTAPTIPGLPPGVDLVALIASLLGGQIAPAQPTAPPPPPTLAEENTALRTENAALKAALAKAQASPPAASGTSAAPAGEIAPVSPAAPAQAAPAGTSHPAVQLSAWALGLGALLQYFGVVGTPFGMGQTPTNAGTLTTLLPLLTGAVGYTGGLNWLTSAIGTLGSAFAAGVKNATNSGGGK